MLLIIRCTVVVVVVVDFFQYLRFLSVEITVGINSFQANQKDEQL